MRNKNKALSNRKLPKENATHVKVIKKLRIALMIAGFTLRLISIIERVFRWFG